MTESNRPDEMNDPARTALPRAFIPIEDGMELFRIPMEPWQSPPEMLQIWGRTPFGEFMMSFRPGNKGDVAQIRATMHDGLYEEIYSVRPIVADGEAGWEEDPVFAPHTPGPWQVHSEAEGRNSLRVCVPDESEERGCRPVAEAEILGVRRLVAEANARLIAAAPDMVAALQGCLEYMEHPEGAAPNGWRLTTAIDAARAAIAKATGTDR